MRLGGPVVGSDCSLSPLVITYGANLFVREFGVAVLLPVGFSSTTFADHVVLVIKVRPEEQMSGAHA